MSAIPVYRNTERSTPAAIALNAFFRCVNRTKHQMTLTSFHNPKVTDYKVTHLYMSFCPTINSQGSLQNFALQKLADFRKIIFYTNWLQTGNKVVRNPQILQLWSYWSRDNIFITFLYLYSPLNYWGIINSWVYIYRRSFNSDSGQNIKISWKEHFWLYMTQQRGNNDNIKIDLHTLC
jgi:hypothetical protein